MVERIDGREQVAVDDGLEAELAPFVERVRMALAEAGYPDAHVYVENGVWIEGVPDEVQEKAWEVCNR